MQFFPAEGSVIASDSIFICSVASWGNVGQLAGEYFWICANTLLVFPLNYFIFQWTSYFQRYHGGKSSSYLDH